MTETNKHNAKGKIRTTRIIILVVLISISMYIFFEYNRKVPDLDSYEPKYELTDSIIINEFNSDYVNAELKYKGVVILIKGTIKHVVRSDDGEIILSIGSHFSGSSVQCTFDSTVNSGSFKEGDAIKLKGYYVGYNHDDIIGSDIILNRCIYLK